MIFARSRYEPLSSAILPDPQEDEWRDDPDDDDDPDDRLPRTETPQATSRTSGGLEGARPL